MQAIVNVLIKLANKIECSVVCKQVSAMESSRVIYGNGYKETIAGVEISTALSGRLYYFSYTKLLNSLYNAIVLFVMISMFVSFVSYYLLGSDSSLYQE